MKEKMQSINTILLAASLPKEERMLYNENRTPATQSPLVIPEMVTLREAANRTHLSYDYLRKLCMTNAIAYIRVGNKYLINM